MASALKSALWTESLGVDIVLNMLKRWTLPGAEIPKTVSIHEFVMTLMQRTIHSTGAPIRVVEPFALGEFCAQNLERSRYHHDAADIRRDMADWKTKMTEPELKLLNEYEPQALSAIAKSYTNVQFFAK